MVRISRKFKDISLSFVRNPVTNDILAITDSDAIKKSIINLVRTRVGERFFNDLLGTNVDSSIFELQSPEVAYQLELETSPARRRLPARLFLCEDGRDEKEIDIPQNRQRPRLTYKQEP